MKLICPNQSLFSDEIKQILKKKFSCSFLDISQSKFNKIVNRYDIVLARFSKDIKYENGSNIKYIISPTTGENHIDPRFFREKKVKVITLKNENSFLKEINASSELTILLILNILRKFKNFRNKKKDIKLGNEINNKKVGIIGLGRIGKKVSKILSSFGAKVYFNDIKNIKNKKTLNFILKNCDIISIHIPLNKNNKNFISKNKISKLKNGSVIINTSRGEIIDESYLIQKLKSGKLFYATDVVSNENGVKKNKLLKLETKIDNLLISPHIGGLTKESIKKTDEFIVTKFLNAYEK